MTIALFYGSNLLPFRFLVDELNLFNVRFFLVVGLLLLLFVGGWLRPVLVDDSPVPGRGVRGWVIGMGVVLLAYCLLSFAANAGAGAALLTAALLTVAFTALYEELLFRGVLVAGFRESGWSELRVWLISTSLFAVLHLANAFSAGVVTSALQVIFAFGAGSTLYLARRVGRGLWLAVLLHFLNNFGALVTSGIGDVLPGEAFAPIGGTVFLGVVLVLAASFVVALVVTRREARAAAAPLHV